jgi:hypothetical protein
VSGDQVHNPAPPFRSPQPRFWVRRTQSRAWVSAQPRGPAEMEEASPLGRFCPLHGGNRSGLSPAWAAETRPAAFLRPFVGLSLWVPSGEFPPG